MNNTPLEFSASVICMDQTNIKDTISNILEVENNKGTQIIDSWHIDLMDGIFVPRLGLAPEIIRDIKKISNKPIEVHCMLKNVEPYLELLADYGADIISFHYEGNDNVFRTIDKIKKLSMKPWVVYNLQTKVNALLTPFVDGIEYMSINPGVLGSKTYLNVVINKNNWKTNIIGYSPKLAIDGGVRWNTIDTLYNNNISYMVAGSGILFNNDGIENNLERILTFKNKHNYAKNDF